MQRAGPLWRALDVAGRALWRALPLVLFLGSLQQALEAWDPPALRAFDTSVMRLVQWVDDGLDRLTLDGWRAADSSTTELMREGPPVGGAGATLPRVTVVSLTPQAYQYYLGGRTPVPRDALACLIDALGMELRNRLNEPRAEGAQAWLPVLGIDIDTAPAPGTEGVTLDAACRELLSGSAAGAPDAPRMEDLLRQLSASLPVAAILLPRPDAEDRARRGAFVDALCRAGPLAGRLRFANPFLLYEAHELATTYPGRRVGGAGPNPYPLLGSVMAGLWRQPPGGATPHDPFCQGPALAQLDDMRQLERVRQTYLDYRRADVNMGLALWRVEYFDVGAPSGPAAGASLADRRCAAAEQFKALPESDIYILSVDSGTVDDKFLVPVAPLPVPGAWVHGAVAVTEVFDPAPASFWHHLLPLALDLLRGALFALACLLLLKAAAGTRIRPLADLSQIVVPLAVALLMLWVEFAFWVAPNARQGTWSPPTLLMAGMALDLILRGHERAADLEAGWPGRERPGPELLRNRVARAFVQIVWAVGIALAYAFVVHAGRDDGAWLSVAPLPAALVLPALGLALMYLALARRFPVLPLPWRDPCPPDFEPPAAGSLPSSSR